MTMVKSSSRRMGAGQFKAKCLSLLDEVSSGAELVITKHGRPVAKLIAYKEPDAAPLEGLILEQKDLLSPIGESWEAER